MQYNELLDVSTETTFTVNCNRNYNHIINNQKLQL